jgi:hypothetical protein
MASISVTNGSIVTESYQRKAMAAGANGAESVALISQLSGLQLLASNISSIM